MLAEAGISRTLPGMVRMNTMRWSGRSQALLAQAVTDPGFISAMQAKGIPESQLRLWMSQTDVPITFRGQMRGWLEDWANANPTRAVGIGS